MQHPYFHVSFRPNVKLVSTVRRFTAELFERMLVEHDVSQKVALATHELLENAVTYSTDGETGVRVEVTGEALVVKTWNRTTPDRLVALTGAIDELNEAPDADAYYQALMERTAHRTDGSGLGFARIRAEADMTVSYEIEVDQVCIEAKAPLTRKGEVRS
jgi:hypothetical protein